MHTRKFQLLHNQLLMAQQSKHLLKVLYKILKDTKDQNTQMVYKILFKTKPEQLKCKISGI